MPRAADNRAARRQIPLKLKREEATHPRLKSLSDLRFSKDQLTY